MRTAMEATRLGVRMFDVHLNGHADSIGRVRGGNQSAVSERGTAQAAHRRGRDADGGDARGQPTCLARPASMGWWNSRGMRRRAGLDGVFTTAQGAPRIRSMCGRRFIIVTPLPTVRDSETRVRRWRGGDSCGRGFPGGRQSDLEGERADARGARDRRANRSWAAHRTSGGCADDHPASSLVARSSKLRPEEGAQRLATASLREAERKRSRGKIKDVST